MASKVLNVQGFPHDGPAKQHDNDFVSADDLRTAFALDMSRMYKAEVPLYGDLVSIVQSVNKDVFASSINPDSLGRLTLERHGAIRLGKPVELRIVSRLFAVLGMQPVGYYDLSAAGLPMHATCFRPVAVGSLTQNPFRVFTTLLRPELVRSQEARDLAERMLSRRNIFSPELMRMLSTAESQGGLYPEQAGAFIREALKTFSWAPVASATAREYQLLKEQHPILADIACFKTAHINHLTPRTLNITLAQAAMHQAGMQVKDRIEGPPARNWPILLRQTSFLALEESIKFKNGDDDDNGMNNDASSLIPGSHKARFGEIEERGAAVTPAGRQLYDRLLDEAMAKSAAEQQGLDNNNNNNNNNTFDHILEDVFRQFPDDWEQLRKQGLVYCEFECTGKPVPSDFVYDSADKSAMIERLVDEAVLRTKPITYEDFLPFSAAGIFQSNIGASKSTDDGDDDVSVIPQASPNQPALELALGSCIIDPDYLYASAQQRSLEACLLRLSKS